MKRLKSLVRNSSRILPVLALTLTGAQQSAYARTGGTSSGGGDLCEDRIKIVRADMRAWIHDGGPTALKLPQGTTVYDYSHRMLDAMDAAKVQCVGPQDAGYPVVVFGTPKICRFDQDGAGARITCDLDKFWALNESDQYVLVHHEFAGLAGIETPKANDSDYSVSNQISGHLADQVVKKLAIKQANPAPVAPCASIDLRNAPAGTKCTTSRLAIFERVSRDYFGEAWKGPDGVIWSDFVGSGTQHDAMDMCENIGGKLPSRSDFERGEANGFRDVLRNTKGHWFWSSSLNPGGFDDAYYFDGNDGSINLGFLSGISSIRCVAR